MERFQALAGDYLKLGTGTRPGREALTETQCDDLDQRALARSAAPNDAIWD
jgi:hypothetical protein